MRRIQTFADIKALKQTENLPALYIEEIKQQFVGMFEAEGEGKTLDTFSLPTHACLYHLNESDDKHWLFGLIEQVEFIEVEKEYYRIGIMQDHQMNIVYFLKGTFTEIIETWLAN
ncbi:hypothetical protein CWR48_02890 [Oceanobacillus arenosus]|uniref:Uncharacterized protein n=1 Tax=Oceanobacillus arenosus TaxID=1229153 RepID=A0A3D8Q190_9BACI|nr:hypothetical protein [Oceanobacillus arenosus]RDW21368.1 hypothetical protein CWR48_02890 [Oceanobacillus arenosus]